MTITLNGTTGITTPAVTNNGAYAGDGISFADGTPSNTLVTTTTGRVGVGTTNPITKFVVSNAGANGYEVATDSDSGNQTKINSYNRAAASFTPLVTDASQHQWLTAGSERMRIDSSGRVTMPYQPAFQARMNTTDGSVAVGGAIATFNDIRVNTGSHFSGTRFTAPVTGNYQFSGTAASYNNSTFRMDLYVNGSIYHIGAEHSDGVSWTIKGWGIIVRLNASDYVEIKIIGTVNQTWTSVSGHLIG